MGKTGPLLDGEVVGVRQRSAEFDDRDSQVREEACARDREDCPPRRGNRRYGDGVERPGDGDLEVIVQDVLTFSHAEVSREVRVTGGPERPLAMLAFDHRVRAFSSVRPSGMESADIRRSKRLIFDAFLVAVERGLGDVRPGVLVDEEFGADIAREVMEHGFPLSMPVERAFEPVLTFEYGENFRAHLLDFRPRWAKVLVHHRTSDAPADKQTQLERLRELSDFLTEESIDLMVEVVVGQSNGDDGSVPSVDAGELRASMAEIQAAGVHVDLWKVEGIASHGAAAQVAAQAEAVSNPATCVVLGAGAPADVVGHWLDVASATAGFSGFAIGRSIWGAPVTAWLDGTLSRDDAVDQIASTYRSCARRYLGARVG